MEAGAEPEEMEKEGTLGEEGPAEHPDSSIPNEDPKPANGEPDSNPKIQSGANKKVESILKWRSEADKD